MRTRWLTLLLLAGMWVFGAVAWLRLPARIPIHWGLGGEIDGWGPRAFAFMLPAVATLAAWLLLAVLPRVGPRRAQMERFKPELALIVCIITLFFAWMQAVTLGASLGWRVDVGRASVAGVGLLLIGICNYFPRLRSNWWIGIRTPWTLESESVWRETHRVGGRTFVLGGALIALGAFLPTPWRDVLMAVGIVAAAGVPVVYSYLLWRREQAGAG
jgi:uncharacterized membrane protein